jgi:hypothetical protein
MNLNLTPEINVEELVQAVKATQFDYFKPIESPDPLLVFWSEGKKYPVGGRGMIGGLIGPEKAGKTFVASKIIESHLTNGSERLNFETRMSGNIMLFDTEQSAFFFDYNQRRIHKSAGLTGNTSKYSAYLLRRWSPMERVLAMEHIIYNTPGIDTVFIDGIVDMLDDYNDLKQSEAAMGAMMRWSFDLNIMLLGVLHVNKGDGKIRGHIGSAFKNKCDFLIKVEQPKRNQYEISNPTGRFLTFPTMKFDRDENTENGDAIYENGKVKSNFV